MTGLTFDGFDSLLLVGIIQGLLIGFLLLVRRSQFPIASYFLASTLLIFSLYNLLIVAYDINLFAVFPSLQNLPLNLILGFGPCIYFYILHSLYPASGLHRNCWIHFVPVSIQIIYYLKLSMNLSWVRFGGPIWKSISQTEQLLSLLSVCIYSFLAIKQVKSYRKQVIKLTIHVNVNSLLWLNQLLGAYMFLWIVWLGYTLTDIFLFDYTIPLRAYFPLYFLVAGLTYWIGTMDYLHPPVINNPGASRATKSTFDYLREEDIQGYLSQLQQLMTEARLYLNPELNLNQVSQQSRITANLISYLLNNRLEQSFSQWVNTYRVEEIKRQVSNPHFSHLTLTGIALECGFNSKATFNRVFKQQTGSTPKQYVKTLKVMKEA